MQVLTLRTDRFCPKLWEFAPGDIIAHIPGDKHPIILLLPTFIEISG